MMALSLSSFEPLGVFLKDFILDNPLGFFPLWAHLVRFPRADLFHVASPGRTGPLRLSTRLCWCWTQMSTDLFHYDKDPITQNQNWTLQKDKTSSTNSLLSPEELSSSSKPLSNARVPETQSSPWITLLFKFRAIWLPYKITYRIVTSCLLFFSQALACGFLFGIQVGLS